MQAVVRLCAEHRRPKLACPQAEVHVFVSEWVGKVEAVQTLEQSAIDEEHCAGYRLEGTLVAWNNSRGPTVVDVEGAARASIEPNSAVLDGVVGVHQSRPADPCTDTVKCVHHLAERGRHKQYVVVKKQQA